MSASIAARARANLIFNAVRSDEKFVESGLELSTQGNSVLLVGNKGLVFITTLFLNAISSRSEHVKKYTVQQETRFAMHDGVNRVRSRVEVSF